MNIENTVFISYRRINISWALAIYQNLTNHGYDVFLDHKSINSGIFSDIIFDNIRSRAHFVVLLTPSALERVGDENDWLRKEIETALDEGRNIVPLMLEGFNYDSPMVHEKLNGKLSRLLDYNALRVPSDYFEAAMSRLRKRFLKVPSGLIIHPLSEKAKSSVIVIKQSLSEHPLITQATLLTEELEEIYIGAVMQKSAEDGISRLIQVTTDHKKNSTAHAVLACLYFESKDLVNASHSSNRAISLDSDNPWANYAQALLCEDGEKQKKDLDRAIQLRSDFALFYLLRGKNLKMNKRYSEAISDYSEAIKYNPYLTVAYTNRAVVKIKVNDLFGALEDSNEALRLDPKSPLVFNIRANILYNLERYQESIADCNEAIRLKPDYAYAYNTRGNSKSANGDIDGAIDDYSTAVSIDPDFVIAKNNLKELLSNPK